MVILCLLAAILVFLFAIFVITNRIVVSSTENIFDCNSEYALEDKYDAIVVLGAKVKDDGEPSHMLEDRLRGAVELYKNGASEVIFLSGDRSGDGYDEVTAMKKYCLDNGVPKEAIVEDGIGYSTYETMFNAIISSGYQRIIVATQRYHLHRGMYIAKKMGADADGFACDYRSYFGQTKRDVREYVARSKDFFKVNVPG